LYLNSELRWGRRIVFLISEIIFVARDFSSSFEVPVIIMFVSSTYVIASPPSFIHFWLQFRINRKGPFTQPCGTLLIISHWSDRYVIISFLIVVQFQHIVSCYKDNNIVYGTCESNYTVKGLTKIKKNGHDFLFFSNFAWVILLTKYVAASIVDLFFLYPNWFSDNTLFLSKKFTIIFNRAFSIIFEKEGGWQHSWANKLHFYMGAR